MVAVRYIPGDAYLIATRNTVALIAADTPPDLLNGIWNEVRSGRGLAAVLEALTGAFGTSLTAIPPFLVAIDEPDGLRLIVRGDLQAVVTGASAPVTVTGRGVTTWSERVIAGAARTEIGPGADAAGAHPELLLRDGIVRAGAAVVLWDEDAAAAPAPAARTAAPAEERTAVEPAAVVDDAEVDDDAVDDEPVGVEPVDVEPVAVEQVIDEQDEASPADPAMIDSSAVMTVSGTDTWLPDDATLAPLSDRSVGADDGAGDAASTPDAGEVADTVASVRVRGDHDGETISLAQARAMRGEAPVAAPLLEPLAPPRMPAPGRLRLSTGQVVGLDRTVVIGRRPRSTRVTGTDLPHLIAVDSPQQDISRSHLELRVEGDSILATDLHTTNGTTLRRPGADPVRLHPGERNVVVPGDILDLGDGILVTVEDIA